MESDELLEFPVVPQSILEKFSKQSGEAIAYVLVKELLEQLSKSPSCNLFDNERDLEWLMEVIDYSLASSSTLTARGFETLSSAVKIYLSWTASVTSSPPPCPKPLMHQRVKYIGRILDALRNVFKIKNTYGLSIAEKELCLSRQYSQIRYILHSLNYIDANMTKELKGELSTRLLFFLLCVSDQMLTDWKLKDSIAPYVPSEISTTLFDCWMRAALSDLIHGTSYWRTLSRICWKSAIYVPFVDYWSRMLIQITSFIVHKTYDFPSNGDFFECCQRANDRTVRNTWLELFNLVGNPVYFHRHAEIFFESSSLNLSYLLGHVEYSFFLSILVIADVIDAICGRRNPLNPIEPFGFALFENKNIRSSIMSTKSSLTHHQSSLSTIADDDQEHKVHRKVSAANRLSTSSHQEDVFSVSSTKIRSTQQVWLALKGRPLSPMSDWHHSRDLLCEPVLGVLLEWLFDASVYNIKSVTTTTYSLPISSRNRSSIAEDSLSQRSVSSVDGTDLVRHPSTNTVDHPRSSAISSMRHSFANSTCAESLGGSNDYSSHSTAAAAALVPPDHQSTVDALAEIPTIDGITAGRAMAVGALCRIVCAKSTKEHLPDKQLASFFVILHESLIARDRLVLCSLIFHTVDLFKLNLRGVQILLPNYVAALDIVFTESLKLSMHPQIEPSDMRTACLKALSSILSWPIVFGQTLVIGQCEIGKSPRARQNASTNVLDGGLRYIDIRQRILRILVHSLRNEVNAENVHLTHALCAQFCKEVSHFDICHESSFKNHVKSDAKVDNTVTQKLFSVSCLRAVLSAICDNLLKYSSAINWPTDMISCLAVFDCLNTLATLPHSILFYEGDLSTGTLVIASLCRYVENQLQKAPMHHSRDMHSSVVAAFYSLGVWLKAAPHLAEVESCLATVAQAIEYGITGGSDLKPEKWKPTSQRIHDSAEFLMNNILLQPLCSQTNEQVIAKLYDGTAIDRFKHFIINNSTILSLHEAQNLAVSKGCPSVIAILRTAYHGPHSFLLHLSSPSKHVLANQKSQPVSVYGEESKESTLSTGTTTGSHISTATTEVDPKILDENSNEFQTKTFESNSVPSKYKLDIKLPPFEPVSSELSDIQTRMVEVRSRLDKGSFPDGSRGSNNVWLHSSLGTLLTQPPSPEIPSSKCDSLRVFLHDMGFLNEASYNLSFSPLENNRSLSEQLEIIDSVPTRLLEIVSLFYVCDGQTLASEILSNNTNLRNTSPQFCSLISQLGDTIEVVEHPHIVTSLKALSRTVKNVPTFESFSLDGSENCIKWIDASNQVELLFVTPIACDNSVPILTDSNTTSSMVLKPLAPTAQALSPLPLSGLPNPLSPKSHFDPAKIPFEIFTPFFSSGGQKSALLEELRKDRNALFGRSIDQINDMGDDLTWIEERERFRQCQEMAKRTGLHHVRENNKNVKEPSYSSSEMSLLTAASHAVKSARFSPTRRPTYIPILSAGSSIYQSLPEQSPSPPHSRPPVSHQRRASSVEGQHPNSDFVNINQHRKAQRTLSPMVLAPSADLERSSFDPTRTTPSSTSPTKSAGSSGKTQRSSHIFFADTVKEESFDEAQIAVSYLEAAGRSRRKSIIPSFKSPRRASIIPSSLTAADSSSTTGGGYKSGFTSIISSLFRRGTVANIKANQQEESDQSFEKVEAEEINNEPSFNRPYTIYDNESAQSGPQKRHSLTKSESLQMYEQGGKRSSRTMSTLSSASSDRNPTADVSTTDRAQFPKRSSDLRIFVVWLERFEDLYHFPYEEMFELTATSSQNPTQQPKKDRGSPDQQHKRPDHIIFYLYQIEECLIRVHIDGVWTKCGQPGPLVNGSVVAAQVIGELLQQTISNIARRKVLEIDNYQMVHNKRRQEIVDFGAKFASKDTYSAYLEKLLSRNSS